jgi:hypothetical protein
VSASVIDEACYHRVQTFTVGEEELLVSLEAVDVAIVFTEQRSARYCNLVYITCWVTSNENGKAAFIAAGFTLTTGTGTLDVLRALSYTS